MQRPRGREQSVLMRGQQAIHAAVLRGEELPMGHVVAEEWPKQTYAVHKPTKSWIKKSREKEAKQRYQKNKRARNCHAEREEAGTTAHKGEEKEQQAKLAKHRRSRVQVKQEREVTRRNSHEQRAERKREQEERRVQRQREREERKNDLAQKRERHLRARQEREQERLWRFQWHEEIKREREQRLARQLQRMACSAGTVVASSSAVSTIFVPSQALVPLPKPT